jgi:hypothetical protein
VRRGERRGIAVAQLRPPVPPRIAVMRRLQREEKPIVE